MPDGSTILQITVHECRSKSNIIVILLQMKQVTWWIQASLQLLSRWG